MPNDEMLTDDFVADLLAKEASDCSLKYSAMGMEAYRSNKKPSNLPKPNTRFLRHIIKDTDTHNKALLAKEAAESKARLKDLEHAEEIKRRKTKPNPRDMRTRQMGDIQAILGGRKRRRTDGEPSSGRDVGCGDEGASSRKTDRHGDLTQDRHDQRKQKDRLSRNEEGRSRPDHGPGRGERRRRSRSREDVSRKAERRRGTDEGRSRSNSASARRRSHSPRRSVSKHRNRSPLGGEAKSLLKRRAQSEDDKSDAEDDDLIGPAPPPKYRGRGTFGGSSEIDRRFSEAYDPRTDVPDGDEAGGAGWDKEVEAYRARQKLRQSQEHRTAAAGSNEDAVGMVGAESEDKTADSVRWSGAGEKREWDRGKVVGLLDGVSAADDD